MSSILTAQRLLERSLRVYGERMAIIDGERRLSYRTLADRSARLAHVLLGHGGGPTRPAAILLPNCAEYLEADVATARVGVTRVGISERLSADECRYIVAHSGASILITTPELFERLADEVPDTLEAILVVGSDSDATGVRRLGRTAMLDYEGALASASGVLDVAPVDPSSPAYILYTSGTTGRPKGATHSQANRVAATVNMLAAELRITRDSVMVHAGGLTHGSGSKAIAFLAAGGCNLVLRRFTPEEFASAVETGNGTNTFLVPTMIQWLEEGGQRVRRAVRKLDQISFGGSPITSALFERAIEAFGPILTQVYGSCEVPHPVTVLRPEDYRDERPDRLLQSAGRATWSTDVKIVDDEGVEVEADAAGELLVRSNYMLSGYWDDEAATGEALTPDGWYSTGDLATIGEDGLVSFRDRKRDLIITGGFNVYPTEVERVLADHPHVSQVAVVGYPDDQWGESVLAYVVPSASDSVSEEELIDWVRERLAGYKKPRRVEFRESLPLGSTGKVLKKELRAALWAGRERHVQ